MSDETIVPKGASEASYRFTVFPWGTNFNPIGAVYLILRKEFSGGKYTILYVGQTGDLSDRFNGHHKQHCFDNNRKSHIGVLREGLESRRLNIESDLIGNYQTACNF